MFTRQSPAQDARDAAFNARRESALAALFPKFKTWADAKRECAALGFTCRPDPSGPFADGSRGYEVFPKGDGRAARYATTPADAVYVARAHALDLAQNRLGFGGASIAAVIETLFRAALRVTVGEWADVIQIDFTVYGAGSAPSARVVLSCDSIRNPISGHAVRAEVTEFCRRDTALALAALEVAQDFAARVADAGGFPVAQPQDAAPILPAPAPAQAGARWTPNRDDLALIRRHATAEGRRCGAKGPVRIEPGIRYNLDHPDAPQSMNLRLVTSCPDWSDSDLCDFATWEDFAAFGVSVPADLSAVVDFYVSGNDGLACNIHATADARGLRQIATAGPDGDLILWERADTPRRTLDELEAEDAAARAAERAARRSLDQLEADAAQAAAQAPKARALRPETAAELAALCAPVSARTGHRADVLAPLAVGAARVALWLARGAEPSDILAAVTERNGARYARALSATFARG